jgi:hypothetical protein
MFAFQVHCLSVQWYNNATKIYIEALTLSEVLGLDCSKWLNDDPTTSIHDDIYDEPIPTEQLKSSPSITSDTEKIVR